jgi:hypothetical protein
MLEEAMSVWPISPPSGTALEGSEGLLVSVSVSVPPRDLEAALDTLAQLDFPINPQIYHNASVEYVYPGGRSESEPVTLVEFPAYESRLDRVRSALAAAGFDNDSIHVAEMLSEIRQEGVSEPAPPGAAYVRRVYRRVPRRGGERQF